MNVSKLVVLFVTVGLVACGPRYDAETQNAEMRRTEENQERLLEAVPTPRLSDSLERRNLVRRLELFNDDDKIGYIYLISYGKVMAFHTVKGKVSSCESLLTTPQQLVPGVWGRQTHETIAVESPDLDGSYGPREDGIFFWTTEGAYVQWKGEYMYTDQPLHLATPPEIVRVLEEK